MKKKTAEKSEIFINALHYAFEHNLDINDKNDVKKILAVIDPDIKSEEEVEKFMKNIQNAETIMDMLAKKNQKKIKLPN